MALHLSPLVSRRIAPVAPRIACRHLAVLPTGDEDTAHPSKTTVKNMATMIRLALGLVGITGTLAPLRMLPAFRPNAFPVSAEIH